MSPITAWKNPSNIYFQTWIFLIPCCTPAMSPYKSKAWKNEKLLAKCNNKGEYVAKNPINVIYYNKYGFLAEYAKKPL